MTALTKGQVIFDKEVSGFKTKIQVWSKTTLRVSVFDHTCHMRFMHTFREDQIPAEVFTEVMSRVKSMQLEYATEEIFLLKAMKGKSCVH